MQTAIEKRIDIEKKIARKCVQTLLAAGYSININNGGMVEELPEPSDEFNVVVAAMFAADEDYLNLYKFGKHWGWVRFIYGNAGHEVISDYTTNLESVLSPVNEYADTFA